MDIILKQDIPNLGHQDDIISVKNGYGRNYLIPKGHAILATKQAKKIHAETIKQRSHKEEKIREEALDMANKLEGTVLEIGAKTSSTGKIFGSVTNIQISEAISAKGFEIDRKNIKIKSDTIKDVGKYSATVKLYKDIMVDIEFEVVSE